MNVMEDRRVFCVGGFWPEPINHSSEPSTLVSAISDEADKLDASK